VEEDDEDDVGVDRITMNLKLKIIVETSISNRTARKGWKVALPPPSPPSPPSSLLNKPKPPPTNPMVYGIMVSIE
jgi:hypothetical protein